MSKNSNPEAVYPPVLYNLKRMTHPSPTSVAVKGSYELYESKQGYQASPEVKKMSIAGTTPGSPGQLQHYNQIIENLQRDLEESKRKESELQQVLMDLKNPLTQSFLENPYLEGSTSNDSMEENFKDTEIKHLQRLVTVLKANLFKSEGSANKVSAAMKERDNALAEVARLSSDIREMQDKYQNLLLKAESLEAAHKEAHKNLQVAREQLQSHNYNGQIVSHLKEEIQKQKYEISTLKELVTRLDQENKGLRVVSTDTSSQSLGNSACSQELEHLHKVVEKLKNTVLEQRKYLLHLRHPNNESNQKSFGGYSPFDFNNPVQEKDSIGGKPSSSPHRNTAKIPLGFENAFGVHASQAVSGHSSQATAHFIAPKEKVPDIQKNQHCTGNEFVQDNFGGTRKKVNPKDNDYYNNHQTLPVLESRAKHQVTNTNGPVSPFATQSPLGNLDQQDFADPASQYVGNYGLNINRFDALTFNQQKTQLQKPSSLDTLTSRNGVDGAGKGTSDSSMWQSRQRNLTSANNSASPVNVTNSEFIDSFDQVDIGLNQGYVNQAGRLSERSHQETERGLYIRPEVSPGQLLMKENPVQMVLYPDMVGHGNFNISSSTSLYNHIYHPPNFSNMGKVTTLPGAHHPVPQANAAGQDIVYVNTKRGEGYTTCADSSVDPQHFQPRQNPDNLCPVCNTNYNYLSLEDFQTHIFECIDDGQDPPETMKAHETPDRTCPMCNAGFGPSSTQDEYENHVHSHFSEEVAVQGFEILQPTS